MSDEPQHRPDPKKERAKRQRRAMRSAVAKVVEEGDADAVVLLASFNGMHMTRAVMSTFGNGIACARMVEKAHDMFEDAELDGDSEDDDE